jgi:hypothetical protein
VDAFEEMLQQLDDHRLEQIGEMCYQLGIALKQRNRRLAAIFLRSVIPLLSPEELSEAALASLSMCDTIEPGEHPPWPARRR